VSALAPAPELPGQAIGDPIDSRSEAFATAIGHYQGRATHGEPGLHPMQTMIEIEANICGM
jgi:hypothetical protein